MLLMSDSLSFKTLKMTAFSECHSSENLFKEEDYRNNKTKCPYFVYITLAMHNCYI